MAAEPSGGKNPVLACAALVHSPFMVETASSSSWAHTKVSHSPLPCGVVT